MAAFLFLLGIFYLVVLPILVFVALSRPGAAEHKIKVLESRLEGLELRWREFRRTTAPTTPKPNPPAAAPVPLTQPMPQAVASASLPPPLPPRPAPAPTPIPTASFVGTAPPPLAATKREIPLPTPGAATPETLDPGAEIRLGARWATRLGIGFLVVAVVFFGIYISKFSSPSVRLAEVVGLAAGVTGLGVWLERKTREFGEAVFAGGLAIFYFAAFAAHAITAMRVIDLNSVGTGLLVRYIAVGLIAFIAWQRNRRHVATMAVALGMISCFFALHNDRMEITLGAALGLMAVAAALRITRGWVWPLAAGYVGAQICYLGSVLAAMGFTLESFFQGAWELVGRHQDPTAVLWAGFTLVYPVAFFILLLATDTVAELRGGKGWSESNNRDVRTGIVLFATILYGLGSWWGGAEFGDSWDSHNLLAAAVVCLAAGWIYRARKDLPDIYEILYAAAGAWTAIYFINEYTGWIRWLALLLESFIFAWRVRRHGSSLAWACLFAVWACSLGIALRDASHLSAAVGSWDAQRWKFAAWTVGSVLLWAWIEKLPRAVRDDEKVCVNSSGYLTAAGGVMLALFAWTNPALPWIFLALGVGVAVFAMVGRMRNAWPTVWSSLLFAMWLYEPAYQATPWAVFLMLSAFTTTVLVATGTLQYCAKGESLKSAGIAAELLGFFSLLYTWSRGFEAFAAGDDYLMLALTLAALVMAALAWCGPWRLTGDLAWVWAFAGLMFGIWSRWNSHYTGVEHASLAAVLVLGVLWGFLARQTQPRVYALRLNAIGLFLPGLLFAGWSALSIPQGTSVFTQSLVLAGGAAAYFTVGRRDWLPGGTTAAAILSIGAGLRTVLLPMAVLPDCWTPAAVAVVILYEGWLARRRNPRWDRPLRDSVLLLVAAAALLVFDGTAWRLPQPLRHDDLTLLWAAAGAVVFVAGLAGRLRSYRYAGLAGLALCVCRMFLVDITDQLGRIFAFGALAVVLLAIGFSYHKLRPWLAGRDTDELPTVLPPVKKTVS